MISLFSPLRSEDPLCSPCFYLHACTNKPIVFVSSAKCETKGSPEYEEGKADLVSANWKYKYEISHFPLWVLYH